MLTSLAFIFLLGLSMAALGQLLKLPRIVGMLLTGIVLGPYALNLLDPTILKISPDLREMALIVILIEAGLSLNLADLKKIGTIAVLMSTVPAAFEILGYVVFAPMLLGVSYIDAAVMGAVLGAVSPAVVVPRMIKLLDEGYGAEKSIPQLIVAGSSCDDLVVIVLFTTFVSISRGGSVNWMEFANIPISIILGIAIGGVFGYALSTFFETAYSHQHLVHNSMKVIIVLGVSFLLMAIETALKNYVAMSGLLAVVSMACVIKMKTTSQVTQRLSEKFSRLWIATEVLLFVLVGSTVDIHYMMYSGLAAIFVIIMALVFRSIGVLLCLVKSPLTMKERIFCIIAYLPKATVQAAIGSVPLSLGMPCGKVVLSVAVLGILITAPLGALGIDATYKKLLTTAFPNYSGTINTKKKKDKAPKELQAN